MKHTVTKLGLFILAMTLLLCFSACGGKSDFGEAGRNGETAPAAKTQEENTAEDAAENTQASPEIGSQEAQTAMEQLAAKYARNENPVAIIVMDDRGSIVLELYRNVAPKTVENFISLSNQGFYDGLTFHRIDPSFMIQGGDPAGNGTGGPGYQIYGEFSSNGFPNDLSHTRGVISMARRSNGNDTAGSQFFICVQDSVFLDGNYAAFGRVLEGMDTVDAIANARRNGETPVSPRIMKLVRVAEAGQIPEN